MLVRWKISKHFLISRLIFDGDSDVVVQIPKFKLLRFPRNNVWIGALKIMPLFYGGSDVNFTTKSIWKVFSKFDPLMWWAKTCDEPKTHFGR